MKDGASGAIVQSYNAQAVVDEQRQIIVAAEVTNECNDKGQLAPMAQRMNENLLALAETPEQNVEAPSSVPEEMPADQPTTLLADAGYWSEDALSDEALKNFDVLVPPGSQLPRKRDQAPAANAPHTQRAEAMRARLKNEADRILYSKRQGLVEPVFGQIKERRGFRRFSLRGLAKVRAEWTLICLTHNLLKLHQVRMAPATA